MTFRLNNGMELPALGFGTYKTQEGDAVISLAIKEGYRYFDTASFYGTEPALGAAIRESGLPREQLFIASKVWKDDMGYEGTRAAFQRSLEALRTEYLDLYLIHWPAPHDNPTRWEVNAQTWRAMEELHREGRIRAIGVSNFLPHHILRLPGMAPMVAQLEFHPGHTQEAALRFCQDRGILVQAWSPLGRGRVLADPLVLELAEKYHATPGQVCLRFALQKGVMPLPKASSSERMRENLGALSFEMEDEDIWRLATMPPLGWGGEHPDRERTFVV